MILWNLDYFDHMESILATVLDQIIIMSECVDLDFPFTVVASPNKLRPDTHLVPTVILIPRSRVL